MSVRWGRRLRFTWLRATRPRDRAGDLVGDLVGDRVGDRGESGNAVVEFVVLGTVMLLPVVYLVLSVGRIQAGAYAVDGAARAAARAYTTATDDVTGQAKALAAVRLGLLDQGFDVDPATVTAIECSATPCLTPSGRVAVAVSVDVVLPGVPAFLDAVVPTHVTVRSTQVAVVDAFRAAPAVAP